MNMNSPFKQSAEEAPEIIRSMRQRVENTENRLYALVGHKDRSALTKNIVFSLAWLLFFVITGLISLLSGFRGVIILVNIIAIMSGCWVALILVFNNINIAKHYWSYLDFSEELSELKTELDEGISNIEFLQQKLDEAKDGGWDLELKPLESIEVTLNNVEKKAKGVPGFNRALLNSNNFLLLFIATVSGTLSLGYQLLERVFIPLSGWSGFSEHTARVISVIVLIVVALLEFYFTRLALSKTNEEVTNLTLLVIPISVICTLIAEFIAVAVLAAGIVVLRWIFILIGIIILIVLFLAVLGLL